MDELSAIRRMSALSSAGSGRNTTLGQQDFLRLMIAQLRNQDPFQPMENGEFLGQMAQFSTVSGIQDLQKSFDTTANALGQNRALQAAALVERDVLIRADALHFDGDGPVRGALELPPGASDARVSIRDASGALVAHFPVTGNAERIGFEWDGTDIDGVQVPAGNYSVKAEYRFGGQTVEAEPMVWGHIDSVSLDGTRGIFINLDGLGAVSLSRVIEIA